MLIAGFTFKLQRPAAPVLTIASLVSFELPYRRPKTATGWPAMPFVSRPESVSVDGRKFEISLRPQRGYRDYTIHLQKFEHDFYPGTEVPRNYASNINLVDPGQQENRTVKIWMNHPLRYQGETFYQSGVNSLSKGTILQVVRNPGWLLPYFSCGLVALGMIIHFGIHLTGFLRRQLA